MMPESLIEKVSNENGLKFKQNFPWLTSLRSSFAFSFSLPSIAVYLAEFIDLFPILRKDRNEEFPLIVHVLVSVGVRARG